ncbi:hypothetical protein HZB07_01850 [Candidatus Saganbacteria bacterium]|nr:hypothetical protein [Candidatus Saganbacteria bacterium]
MDSALDLRQDYKEKYREALDQNLSTITAAPFFSYKTQTIRALAKTDPDIQIIDFRNNFIVGSARHIFLESIEIATAENRQTTLDLLRHKKKTIHLITHLYYFEDAAILLPNAQLLFPQLLNHEDITVIRRVFADLPATDKQIAENLIDYFDGWPAIAHLCFLPDKINITMKLISALAANPKVNQKEYFGKFSAPLFKQHFDLLSTTKPFDPQLAEKSIQIPAQIWQDYQSRKIDIKLLCDSVANNLWYSVKYGYLWLDEEKGQFKVPKIIADLINND